MSLVKRMQEDHDNKRSIAIAIAVQSGALRSCEAHDTTFEGNKDAQAAYMLGNAQLTAGKHEGVFESRRDMTDTIKEVIDEHIADECPLCAKIRDED